MSLCLVFKGPRGFRRKMRIFQVTMISSIAAKARSSLKTLLAATGTGALAVAAGVTMAQTTEAVRSDMKLVMNHIAVAADAKPIQSNTLSVPSVADDNAADAKGKISALPQETVYSDGRAHGGFVWIHLRPSADAGLIARRCAAVQDLVDKVTPADDRDESNEVLASVGFSQGMVGKINGLDKKKNFLQPKHDFSYHTRHGAFGSMPATGGDLFVHVKSNSESMTREFARRFVYYLGEENVDRVEDTYGYVYRDSRDLSGYIDGIANPSGPEWRYSVAVDSETGGAYCMTQRWVHKFPTLRKTPVEEQDKWIGRVRSTGADLEGRPNTSHVERTSVTVDGKELEIVRQSMPYGNVNEAGLFFIAYCNTPATFDVMLDRMTGHGTSTNDDNTVVRTKDGINDSVMRMTLPVTGQYWYFPSKIELAGLKSAPSKGSGKDAVGAGLQAQDTWYRAVEGQE